MSRRFTGDECDLGELDTEFVSQHTSQCVVGFAFFGSLGDGDFEPAGVNSDNSVLPSSRLGLNGQGDAECRLFELDYQGSDSNPRKRSLPTRIIVAPSSMATSKSLLMPIESSRSERSAVN